MKNHAIDRRNYLKGAVAGLWCAALAYGASHAAVTDFPTKPIRIIIPTAPGGGSDQLVRMLGQKYTQAWGQQVVVDH